MTKLLRGFHKVISTLLALIISIITIPLGLYASILGRFSEFSLVLAYVPFYFGEYVRYFYYKALLESVGKNVRFKFGSFCQYRETKIGNNVLIGYFNSLGLVEMGDDILIGGYVNFTSGLNQHSFEDPNKKINEQSGKRTKIIIGSDIWIGNNAVICANVGNRSVVGAGSVVVNNLDGYSVNVGSPAKQIKKLHSKFEQAIDA